MPAEQVTAQPFIKNAQARIAAGRKHDALRELHTFFARSSRASFEWSPILDEYVKLHAKLSIELRDEKCIWDALSKFRAKFHQLHYLEKFPQVVSAYILEAKAMLDAAKKRASDDAAAQVTLVGQAVREMTGASLESLAEDRALESSFSLYHAVMTKCLKALSMDGSLERYFQFAINSAFNAYRDARRVREFMSFSNTLRIHMDIITAITADQRLIDHKMLILSDKYYQDNVAAMMRTKHTQMLAAAELGNWDNVYNSIMEVRALMTELRRNGRVVPVSALLTYQQDLKSICFRSKQYAFGAHAAIRYAMQARLDEDLDAEDVTLAATEAVLAVLCVQPASRKATVSIAHDAEKEKQVQLAKAFMVPNIPTRASLTVDLQRFGLLEAADPVARELFACLSNAQSVAICQRATPLLSKLAENAALQQLLPAIHNCAIRSLLGAVSSCFSQVSIEHFMSLVSFYDVATFASKVEPLIVSVAADPNSAISVAIDDASSSIRFDSTASLGHRAVGVESEFSQRLSTAVHHCFSSTSAARAAKPADRTKLLTRIEEERLRMFNRSQLCDQRLEKQHEREKLAKEREDQRRADDLERRKKREAERNEKRREAELRKVSKQVAAQEAVERRKWVLKQLSLKHKGFTCPVELAHRSQEEFASEVTARLLEFRRKVESTKESDTKSMDYFERACREEEGPLRVKHDEELAAANARKYEERRENRMKQHREDWEKAIQTKRRLGKFESHRDKYESDLGAAIQRVTKVSKRDKESADLDAFKEARRAAAAADAPAEPAAAAEPEPAPAPASPASAEPKPAAAPGKWVPKGRR